MTRTSEQLKQLFQERKRILEKKKEAKKKPKTKKEKRELTPEEIEAKKEYQRKYAKEYYKQHQKEIQEKAAIYRETHRDFIRQYNLAWKKKQELPSLETFQKPPVRKKSEVKKIYADWLNALQEREKQIKNEKLIFINNLIQESIKIMGRNRLTNLQAREKYNATVELLHSLSEKRKSLPIDSPERITLTKQISSLNAKLSNYRRTYNISKPQKKVEEPLLFNQAKNKLRELEDKADKMIKEAQARGNVEEVKKIQEAIENVRLRVKYSYS